MNMKTIPGARAELCRMLLEEKDQLRYFEEQAAAAVRDMQDLLDQCHMAVSDAEQDFINVERRLSAARERVRDQERATHAKTLELRRVTEAAIEVRQKLEALGIGAGQ